MFFTYVYRELRRRHRQALLTALGLAVGVALVVAVTAYAGGVSNAQDEVLHSLYGVGTDITVSQTQKFGEGGPQRFGMQPPGQSQQGKKFSRDALTSSPGQKSISAAKVTAISGLRGVAATTGSLSLSSLHVTGSFADRRPWARRLRERLGRSVLGRRVFGRRQRQHDVADAAATVAHQHLVVLHLGRRREQPQARSDEFGPDQLGALVHHR